MTEEEKAAADKAQAEWDALSEEEQEKEIAEALENLAEEGEIEVTFTDTDWCEASVSIELLSPTGAASSNAGAAFFEANPPTDGSKAFEVWVVDGVISGKTFDVAVDTTANTATLTVDASGLELAQAVYGDDTKWVSTASIPDSTGSTDGLTGTLSITYGESIEDSFYLASGGAVVVQAAAADDIATVDSIPNTYTFSNGCDINFADSTTGYIAAGAVALLTASTFF